MPSAAVSQTASGLRRVQRLHFLSLLLLSSCGVSSSSLGTGANKRSPKIIETNKTTGAEIDKPLTVTCTARFLKQQLPLQLLYWLVNGTFVEDQYPDGRVTEGKAKMKETDNYLILKRSLQFKCVKETDFTLTFTCVAQDPGGMDKKEIQLRQIPVCTHHTKGKRTPEAVAKVHGQ